MGSIKDRGKTYRFIFNSDELGERKFKFNPDGWTESEYGLQKSDDDGIIFVFSGDYTYLKDAYDYIHEGYTKYGVLWKAYLTFEKIGNHSFRWETLFDNRKLDFTRVIQSAEKGHVYKIPLTDSGFYEKIKAREKDLIPYSRLTTLDGGTIEPFTNEYEDVTVFGQEIIIENNIIVNESDVSDNLIIPSFTNTSSEDMFINVPVQTGDGAGFEGVAESEEWVTSRMFFNPQSIGKISGTITITYSDFTSGSNHSFHIYDYKTLTPIDVFQISSFFGTGSATVEMILDEYEYDEDTRLVLLCGSSNAFNKIFLEETNPITVTDRFPETLLDHVNPFQAHQRVLESITGESDSFISSVLDTDGKWAHVYLSNGYLCRQFTTDEAQLSFKWQELKEYFERKFCLEYRLVTVDGVKKMQCEDKDYWYSNDIGTTVSKIENNSFSRELDIKKYYSAIEVGTPKADYEEAGSLNDFMTQASYTTILSTFDNKLDLTTSYQDSGVWYETVRRLVKNANETTDSSYDNDVSVMETIESEGVLIQRTTEDFDTVNGIDEITTPINLNLTPARSVYRWGKWIRVGLQKYLGQTLTIDIGFGEVTSFFPTYIKFNKSEILTELSTVRNDEGIEVSENVDIDPNSLDEPIITGNIIKVNGDLSYQDIKTIEDDTTKKIDVPDEISGERIQGWPILATIKPVGESLTNLEIMESREVTEDDNAIQWTDQENIDWTSSESIDWV